MSGLYEKVLGGLAPSELPAPKPPRASAAVVPWRRRDGVVEVYWVRRSDAVRFMPGWHAFPGGAVHRTDREVPADPPPGIDPAHVSSLPEGLVPPGGLERDLAPGIVACALRELIEETGILPLAGGAPREQVTALRTAVLDDPCAFGPGLAEASLELDTPRLTFAGRWLTPPFAPLRFDNRFFLLEWPAGENLQPTVLPGELDHGEWVGAADALDRWRRGKVMAAPPIVHLLEVLAEDGPEEGLGRMLRPTEADLGPYRRVEFRPGIVMFPMPTPTLPPATTTNSYLLGGADAVLVDAGPPDPFDQERLVTALAEARSKLGRRVTAIWLTHHHPDHVGAVAVLRDALGVPVLAHPATAERLAPLGIAVDGEISDGQRFDLGGGFEVTALHTPGHAKGHLAFWVPAQRSLVCGDLVSALSTIVVDPPEGHMGDYLGSLRRMAELGPKTLFPSHGPALYPGAPVLERFVDHRLWREERIFEAWSDGSREPGEIVPKVYDDAPRIAWPLAERQVLAHLDHLRDDGRIR